MFATFAQNFFMPRPKRSRKMFSLPLTEGFKPIGVRVKNTETLILLHEEYEALKLADYNNLSQEEAAKRMNVSRPTFSRIYDKARKTIAKAFVEGKIIIIKGGDFFIDNNLHDPDDKLKNKKIRYESGIGGSCICLKCDIRLPHKTGKPCMETECPTCGKPMLRENSYMHQQQNNTKKD